MLVGTANRGTSQATERSNPNERGHELVVIRRFLGLPETLLAKSILDSARIECYLWDEKMIGLDWLASPALGGMRLVVRKKDADAADELLGKSSKRRSSAKPPKEQPGTSE